MRRSAGWALGLLLLGGCMEEFLPPGVEVVTKPPGAVVRLGEHRLGTTPLLIPRRVFSERERELVVDSFTVVVEKEGYEPVRFVLTQRSGRVFLELKPRGVAREAAPPRVAGKEGR
ncbi:MAG: PEGA domain-containing protein [Nitrospinota bacterium]